MKQIHKQPTEVYTYDVEVTRMGWMIVFRRKSDGKTWCFSFFPEWGIDERREMFFFFFKEQRFTKKVIENIDGKDVEVGHYTGAVLSGYNSYNYDDIILGFILDTRFGTRRGGQSLWHAGYFNAYEGAFGNFSQDVDLQFRDKVYALSYGIIHFRDWQRSSQLWLSFYRDFPSWKMSGIVRDLVGYETIDIMAILNMRVSLKKVAAAMGLEIVELPFEPEAWRPRYSDDGTDFYEELVRYNKHDVWITEVATDYMWWVVSTRFEIRDLFDLPAQRMSDPQIAKAYIRDEYKNVSRELLGQTAYIPRADDLNPHVEYRWDLGDTISSDFEFHSPALKEMYAELLNWGMYTYKDDLAFDVEIGSAVHRVRQGGCHSDDPSRVLYSDGDSQLYDVDFASFYPFLIMTFDLWPRHLSSATMRRLFQNVIQRRIAAKRAGDKGMDIAMKIILNSGMYGLLDDQWWGMRSPEMRLAVSLNGQLMLLEMIDRFHHAGIEVLSSNTDGALVRVPNGKEDAFDACLKAQSKKWPMPIEATPINAIVQQSISDYAAEQGDHELIYDRGEVQRRERRVKLKKKGRFMDYVTLKQSRSLPVIHKAIVHAFITNRDTNGDILEEIEGYVEQQTSPREFFKVLYAGTKTWEDEDGVRHKGTYRLAVGKSINDAVDIGRVARVIPHGGKDYVYRVHPKGDIVGHAMTEPCAVINTDIGSGLTQATKDYIKREARSLALDILGAGGMPKAKRVTHSRWTAGADVSLRDVVRTLGGYKDGNKWRANDPYNEHSNGRHVRFWQTENGVRVQLFGVPMTLTEFLANLREDVQNKVRRDPPSVRFYDNTDVEKETTTHYVYKTESGDYVLTKVRVEGVGDKRFTLLDHKDHVGGKAVYKKAPPYRVNEWKDSSWVVLCEGEKDVDRLTSLGVPATCFLNHTMENYHRKHFYGKAVIVFPDNDAPGESYANTNLGMLRTVARRVTKHRWPDDLAVGFDVSDYGDVFGDDALVDLVNKLRMLIGA